MKIKVAKKDIKKIKEIIKDFEIFMKENTPETMNKHLNNLEI